MINGITQLPRPFAGNSVIEATEGLDVMPSFQVGQLLNMISDQHRTGKNTETLSLNRITSIERRIE
jgi:hypothetical protein